jgi:TolA-binding protein
MTFRRILGPAALFFLLGVASCAYYNTFFVAKKSFNLAEDSVARSQSDKLPADALTNYDATLVQCRKLLLRFPKSRWADDAVYLMGASYYGKGDYDSALVRLNDLVESYPKSGFRPDALFLMGMCEVKQHNYGKGQEVFDRVLMDYPRFSRRDEIYFTMADAAANRRDRIAAIRGYERIVRELPKSRRTPDALRRIGEIYFDAGKYDSASVSFSNLYESARDDHKRAEAAVLQAQTLVRLDRSEEALRLVRETMPKSVAENPGGGGVPGGGGEEFGRTEYQGGGAPVNYSTGGDVATTDDVPRLKLQEAAALNQLGRMDEALTTLRWIMSRYGSSNYAVEAQFQIGYTYETLLDSLDAARNAYEKVAQLPGRSAFKEQAAQRADAVRAFINLQKQAQKEDAAKEARAAAALRMAESLLFDRGLTREAAEQYRKIEEEFPDTRTAARACYALAYIKWKKDADSLGAHDDFRALVGRYPDSPQARSAIDLLARHGADTTGLHGLLRAIVPDSIAMAVPDSASTAARDSSAVPDSIVPGAPAPVGVVVPLPLRAGTAPPQSTEAPPIERPEDSGFEDRSAKPAGEPSLESPQDSLPPDSLRRGPQERAP